MASNFTSGWLGNSERAWHGLGVVTAGTLPAREAFETANALFTVEKRELEFPLVNDNPQGIAPIRFTQPAGVYGLIRTDTQDLLGVVTKQYEIVQNDSLLRMAEFIREEVDMDCVIVLSDGAKVCFTATLRGAEADIVPGDTIKRRIVGYLGHDGKTGCGAKFTNIRVVCQNTLTAALRESGASASITHKGTANANFDALINSIDVARQDFTTECELMREFSQFSITNSQFNEFVDEVYNINEGQAFRKRDKINAAMNRGYGVEFSPGTLWTAVNAITQIETSSRGVTAAKARAQFARGVFGQGAVISKRAFAVARDLVTA